MPPELLSDGMLTKAADVYAFGKIHIYNFLLSICKSEADAPLSGSIARIAFSGCLHSPCQC